MRGKNTRSNVQEKTISQGRRLFPGGSLADHLANHFVLARDQHQCHCRLLWLSVPCSTGSSRYVFLAAALRLCEEHARTQLIDLHSSWNVPSTWLRVRDMEFLVSKTAHWFPVPLACSSSMALLPTLPLSMEERTTSTP